MKDKIYRLNIVITNVTKLIATIFYINYYK
jgi:hypothetical protein